MPLAAVVAQSTLVLHGGLWRKPADKKRKALGAAGRRAASKCAKRGQPGAQTINGAGDTDWMPSTGSGRSRIVLGTLKYASHLLVLPSLQIHAVFVINTGTLT